MHHVCELSIEKMKKLSASLGIIGHFEVRIFTKKLPESIDLFHSQIGVCESIPNQRDNVTWGSH